MKNQDTRVQMTKRLLYESLLELMKVKPIGSIKVKEIVENAGINRGTFYLHYDSPAALLKDMENNFMQSMYPFFETILSQKYHRGQLEQLYEIIWKNKEKFCILLGPNGDPAFPNFLRDLSWERTIDEWNREFPEYSREKLNFLFDFVFSGLTGTLLSWLRGEHSLTVEDFSRRMERLGHYALLSVKEF